MTKLLLPVDGSERSLRSINTVARLYPPEDSEITFLRIAPSLGSVKSESGAMGALEQYSALLAPYQVKKVFLRGVPGPTIVQFAKEEHFDTIVMTRSTRESLKKLGSVTTYVARHADFIDLILLREVE